MREGGRPKRGNAEPNAKRASPRRGGERRSDATRCISNPSIPQRAVGHRRRGARMGAHWLCAWRVRRGAFVRARRNPRRRHRRRRAARRGRAGRACGGLGDPVAGQAVANRHRGGGRRVLRPDRLLGARLRGGPNAPSRGVRCGLCADGAVPAAHCVERCESATVLRAAVRLHHPRLHGASPRRLAVPRKRPARARPGAFPRFATGGARGGCSAPARHPLPNARLLALPRRRCQHCPCARSLGTRPRCLRPASALARRRCVGCRNSAPRLVPAPPSPHKRGTSSHDFWSGLTTHGVASVAASIRCATRAWSPSVVALHGW